jgi:hypothetical protein
VNKPFSRELYNRDDAAKEFVIDYFTIRHGFFVYVNPDPYGIDLIVENERGRFELEVEVKHNWKGSKFPYKTIHFAARKLKFAQNPENVSFIMLNDDWSYGLVIEGETFAQSPIIVKDTIYTQRERFVEIPFDKGTLLRLF